MTRIPHSLPLRRRAVLRGLPALWVGLVGLGSVGARTAAGEPGASVQRLRRISQTPAWFTSGNWSNAAFDPWTDYIAGRIGEREFTQVCSVASDYCLRDIWNLRTADLQPIDWARWPANWPAIHALVLRYFRSGDLAYLARWRLVVADHARWLDELTDAGRLPTRDGRPAALLEAGLAWGGILTALGIAAKAAGAWNPSQRKQRSPYAPNLEPLDAAAAEESLPDKFLLSLSRCFSRGPGRDLGRHYGLEIYVPNQRVFGLEALASACALLPSDNSLSALQSQADEALLDATARYVHLDGGQLEQSYNYAQDLVGCLARLQQLPRSPAPVWQFGAESAVQGWQRQCAAVELPSGGLPQMGNAVAGRVRLLASAPRFAATSMAFPYSGIYVQRSGWDARADHLFFFHRRAARGHSMAGSNSLQLQGHGRPLLVAGGPADYRAELPAPSVQARYLAESSSWKTNTVLVDELSQAGGNHDGLARDARGQPLVTSVPAAPILARWLGGAVFDYLEGRHTAGYSAPVAKHNVRRVDDVVHWRQIVYVRPLRLWLVVDVMQTSGSHSYTQVWKLPPPRGMAGTAPGFEPGQVVMDEAARRIVTTDDRPGAVNLGLVQFSPVKLAYRKAFGSDGLGYFSPGPLSDAVPAVDLHAQWQGQGPQVCVTALVPFMGQQLPGQWQARTGTTAAGRYLAADGAQLDFEASSSARKNSLWPDGPGCDLVVRLTPAGKAASTLVIGADESFVMTGRERTPITVPSTFRWETTADGALRPVYA